MNGVDRSEAHPGWVKPGVGVGFEAPKRLQALVATDVCLDLARGAAGARAFFAAAGPDLRLSTASYLELLAEAEGADRRRIHRSGGSSPVARVN